MYGLVNIAIAELITRQRGPDAWHRASRDLGISGPFIAMRQYPDELTGRLVGWMAQELAVDGDTVLEQVGEFWVHFAHERYDELLHQLGRPLSSALQNLDLLHARVALSFPDLNAPSFRCTDVGDGELHLHYYSSRPGLTPMVVGLIRGLAAVLATEVEVTVVDSRASGADHDTFLVRYPPAGGAVA